MKKTIVIIVLSLITSPLFAQQETPQARSAIKSFTGYFNAGNYDAICQMFAEKAKQKFPPERTLAFLNQMKDKYGGIKGTTFSSNEGAFVTYMADLDSGQVTIGIAVDADLKINGLYARPIEAAIQAPPKRNTTKLKLPLAGEWTIFWGGDTKALNQHAGVKFQQYAFDIVIDGANKKSYKTDGKLNTDYYAFGQNIIAPADAQVVMAVDGVDDNIPGQVNAMYVPGNSVMLKTSDGEYLFFAHLRQHTVKVKQGDLVKQGQLIGQCGNSGNSSEPHLHFHIQNGPDFAIASGIKCYFGPLYVNGTLVADHSPIKGEKIKNIDSK